MKTDVSSYKLHYRENNQWGKLNLAQLAPLPL